ncbi:MAG: hypothetical protein ACLFUU_02930 [Desulfobacteraceae bacterium]
MEPQKTMVCMCENCGSEGEMTIKCEEVIPPQAPTAEPQPQKVKRTVVCSKCGNEAEMIVDL